MSNTRPVKALTVGDCFTKTDAENNQNQLKEKEIRFPELYDPTYLKDVYGFQLMKSLTKKGEDAHCELINISCLEPDFISNN